MQQKLFHDMPRELARRIVAKHGSKSQEVIVYGSVAHGEARWSDDDPDERSDIDIRSDSRQLLTAELLLDPAGSATLVLPDEMEVDGHVIGILVPC